VPNFVISYPALFFVFQPAALSFRPGHHLLNCVLEVLLADFVRMPPRRQQRRLIHRIGQIGSGETWRRLGDSAQFRRFFQRFASRMHAQDGLPSVNIRGVNDHLPIETPRPEEGPIQYVWPIRR